MKLKSLLAVAVTVFILPIVMSFTVSAAKYYVSSTGTNSNSGIMQTKPLASIGEVYIKDSKSDKTIILLDNTYYEDAVSNYTYDVTIRGYSSDVVLILPPEISLKGNVKIENVTLYGMPVIYANGYSFEIADSVTSSDSTHRMTVYGGTNGTDYTGNTDLKLYSGRYNYVFGGCKGASLTGTTNVVLGGNANKGDGIDDSDESTISPCYIYGGGNDGSVSGKTNVTLTGNAVTKYIIGAGMGTGGTATDTNIFVEGGKVMNVYGGSIHTTLTNCNTHITITGGLAESLFGGSSAYPITGNTYLTLLGGEVSRRVYTGCYNNAERNLLALKWGSEHYVTGTTTLAIGPNMKLITTTELSNDNNSNLGVFSGSRIESGKNTYENNTIIFLDGCYSSQKSFIGDKGSTSYLGWFKSSEKYTVNATAGGIVEGTSTPGKIKVTPNKYNYALIGSATSTGGNMNISTGTTEVKFLSCFAVSSISNVKDGNGIVTSTIKVEADNKIEASNPTLYCSLHEENGKLVDIKAFDAKTGTEIFAFTTPVNGNYFVKAFILDENLIPLCVLKKS